MSHRTALATSERAVPGLRKRHIRGVMDAAQNSYSASTRRNYEGAWRLFARWAGREGFSALPAKPETVAAYLAERAADGLSPASLRMDRAAIRHHHSEAGHANPADNESVRRVMRGLTRRAAHQRAAPRGRPPLSRPRRWRRSARPPTCAAPDRAAEPRGRARPAAAGAWTWRSSRSCGTPCSGAPRPPRSPGPTWNSGATDPPGSRCAARRVTRMATGPPCT